MHSALATLFEKATHEVASLMSTALDQAGVIDSAHFLASAGLRDGEVIVRDFLAHSEAGLAYDHLRYMIAEADLCISDDCNSWLRSIALELGLPANDAIAKSTADEAVSEYLRTLEREMDLFGSALPENRDRPPHRLAVVDVQENDFGWVYVYNSKEFMETGDFCCSLAGNAPVIVDRSNGKLYETGTAQPIDHYVNEFRRGVRRAL
jgi:hypothetical protein